MGEEERGMGLITREFFEESFLASKELMGWKITEKRARLIYDKIYEFDKTDFIKALDIITDYENFSFSAFLKILREQRAIRLEKESEDNKRREEQEFRIWWKSHKGTRQTCINNYECFACKREYCDLVAKEACECIKKVLSGDMTDEAMNKQLSKFRGLGWDQTTPF